MTQRERISPTYALDHVLGAYVYSAFLEIIRVRGARGFSVQIGAHFFMSSLFEKKTISNSPSYGLSYLGGGNMDPRMVTVTIRGLPTTTWGRAYAGMLASRTSAQIVVIRTRLP